MYSSENRKNKKYVYILIKKIYIEDIRERKRKVRPTRPQLET